MERAKRVFLEKRLSEPIVGALRQITDPYGEYLKIKAANTAYLQFIGVSAALMTWNCDFYDTNVQQGSPPLICFLEQPLLGLTHGQYDILT